MGMSVWEDMEWNGNEGTDVYCLFYAKLYLTYFK